MPDIAIDELRLPELHLPEIKREEIERTLSGIHPPELDLSGARKLVPDIDPSAVPAAVQARMRKLPIDFGKLFAAGLAAARFIRLPTPRVALPRARRSREHFIEIVPPAPRRSRRRFAILAIGLAALASWGLLRDPGIRARLVAAARRARTRLGEQLEWLREQRDARFPSDEIASDEIASDVTAPAEIASDGIESTTVA